MSFDEDQSKRLIEGKCALGFLSNQLVNYSADSTSAS